MRIIDLLLLLVLLPLFSLVFSVNLSSLSESHEKYRRLAGQLNRDKVILASFRSVCSQKTGDDSDFDEFSAKYGALFGLDSLSVKTLGLKDGKRLVECTWSAERGKIRILAVCEW
ncbi:MAG: hypothetical protein IJ257_05540 [Treponema sp.]|nr:hypothetical protein [Treponema sp.]